MEYQNSNLDWLLFVWNEGQITTNTNMKLQKWYIQFCIIFMNKNIMTSTSTSYIWNCRSHVVVNSKMSFNLYAPEKSWQIRHEWSQEKEKKHHFELLSNPASCFYFLFDTFHKSNEPCVGFNFVGERNSNKSNYLFYMYRSIYQKIWN